MTDGLEVSLVEGFWGGSHKAAAQGWSKVSRHRVRVESLPPRFWKWRMRGAAFEFARRLRADGADADVLFATDLVDLAHLLALLPRRLPSVLYFHESQASYPAPAGSETAERDYQYAFTNLASALAADRVAFNSVFHETVFFEQTEALLRRMPDHRPLWALEDVRKKSVVLPLGVTLSDIPDRPPADGGPPVVLWNHRWEYDKDPETFFEVLLRLQDRGVGFRLIVAGESFARVPEVFARARARLGQRVIHWGYAADRADYVALLVRADVAVSTARQENFGLSLVEAVYSGAHPLAPARLSYPEVLPRVLHDVSLYRDEAELERRLEALLTGASPRAAPGKLRGLMDPCRWEVRGPGFDALVVQVFGRQKV